MIPLNMKRQNIYEDLQRFVEGSGMVRGTLGFDSLNSKILILGTETHPLQIFYGETVDEFGMPVDSLKYYFFLSILQKHLESIGIHIEATVVIADVASLLNDSAREKQDTIIASVKRRKKLLDKIITVYDLPITVRLMSDIFDSDDYKERRRQVDRAAENPDVFKKIEPLLSKTVLVNRLAQERKKKFQYALDVIATGLLFNMKIGPPRERFYDEAGGMIAKEISDLIEGKSLLSMYLQPTQPLGQNFAFFLTHPEIVEYGVTPYKAGSNKLQEYRIVLGETSFLRATALIQSSFETLTPETVHPVFDLFIICDMAKKLLGKDYVLPDHRQTKFEHIDEMKMATLFELNASIYKPLGLEVL